MNLLLHKFTIVNQMNEKKNNFNLVLVKKIRIIRLKKTSRNCFTATFHQQNFNPNIAHRYRSAASPGYFYRSLNQIHVCVTLGSSPIGFLVSSVRRIHGRYRFPHIYLYVGILKQFI